MKERKKEKVREGEKGRKKERKKERKGKRERQASKEIEVSKQALEKPPSSSCLNIKLYLEMRKKIDRWLLGNDNDDDKTKKGEENKRE